MRLAASVAAIIDANRDKRWPPAGPTAASPSPVSFTHGPRVAYETLLSTVDDAVATITLNRP